MVAAAFPPIQVAGSGQLYARFVTSMGTMVARLEEHRAPDTVKNFVGLATGTQEFTDPKTGQTAKRPYYDGLVFHRVIPRFMIQGGCPQGNGRGNPGYKFKDEFHPELRHSGSGILSMANSGPSSNGSQFFICEVATPHLDNKHSVFGQVFVGNDIIKQITHSPTGPGDRPVKDIVLQRVEIFRSETEPTA